MTTKDFKFELKAMSEDGTFEGYLSVFDVVDRGGDLVEKGAFSKTIKEAPGGFVPMLWQHDEKKPIGKLYLSEDDYGLKVRGELSLGVAQADEAYKLLKDGVVRGLSIGYKAIRKQMDKGVRHLKEIALFEGSVVTFPMLPLAQVTAVKDMGGKSDFLTELAEAQMYAMRGMIMQSLCRSLDDIAYEYSEDMDAAARIAASSDSIDQFKTAYMQHLPMLLEMRGEKGDGFDLSEQKSSGAKVDVKSAKKSLKAAIVLHEAHMDGTEPTSMASQEKLMTLMVDAYESLGGATAMKSGRRISASSRTAIEEAITKLQALLTDEQATSEEDAGKSVEQAPPKQYSTTPEIIPDAHLVLSLFDKFTIKGVR